MVQCILQRERLRCRIGSIERPQCADDRFARQHRGQQPDADFPIEAEWPDDRLDKLSQLADCAICKLRKIPAVHRQMAQNPQRDGDADDDRSCLVEKNASPVVEAQAQ